MSIHSNLTMEELLFINKYVNLMYYTNSYNPRVEDYLDTLISDLEDAEDEDMDVILEELNDYIETNINVNILSSYDKTRIERILSNRQ